MVARTSAEDELDGNRAVRRRRRRRRRPLTRRLNRNHNRVVRDVFKGAATAASVRPGTLHAWYQGLLARGLREELARGLREELARVTLARLKKATDAKADCTATLLAAAGLARRSGLRADCQGQTAAALSEDEVRS